MFLTLIWVLIFSTIVVLFVDRWIPYFKKGLAVPGVALFLPLSLVSIVAMIMLTPLVRAAGWLHFKNQEMMYLLLHSSPPFSGEALILPALWITVIAMIPTTWFYWTAKPFRPFVPPYWSSHYVWLVLTILMVLWLK